MCVARWHAGFLYYCIMPSGRCNPQLVASRQFVHSPSAYVIKPRLVAPHRFPGLHSAHSDGSWQHSCARSMRASIVALGRSKLSNRSPPGEASAAGLPPPCPKRQLRNSAARDTDHRYPTTVAPCDPCRHAYKLHQHGQSCRKVALGVMLLVRGEPAPPATPQKMHSGLPPVASAAAAVLLVQASSLQRQPLFRVSRHEHLRHCGACDSPLVPEIPILPSIKPGWICLVQLSSVCQMNVWIPLCPSNVVSVISYICPQFGVRTAVCFVPARLGHAAHCNECVVQTARLPQYYLSVP